MKFVHFNYLLLGKDYFLAQLLAYLLQLNSNISQILRNWTYSISQKYFKSRKFPA